MDRQQIQRQADLLIRATMGAGGQQFAPEIQAEIRCLLKQLLAECAKTTSMRQVDE